MHGPKLRRNVLIAGLAALPVLAGSAVLGLSVGSSGLGGTEVFSALAPGAEGPAADLVRGIRLPIVALAAAVGATLAAAGTVTQAVLRNPLADPYVLGVSGGAAVGVAAVGVAAGGVPGLLGPIGAVAGATLSLVVLQSVGRGLRRGGDSGDPALGLLLAGVAFNAFASALVLLLHTVLAPQQSQALLLALVGAIQPARLPVGTAGALAFAVVLAWGALVVRARRLDVLALGDEMAAGLGVDARRERATQLVLASVLVGCSVAAAGMVGFVGLVVPHALRRVLGPSARPLLLTATVYGACFVVVADAAGRALFGLAGSVLPVGAITALVGAPVFLWLLARGLGREGAP